MFAQAQMAQQPQQQEPQGGLDSEQLAAIEEVRKFSNMPEGDSVEEVTQRIMIVLEEAGIMEQVAQDPQAMKELEADVKEFAQAIASGDKEAAAKSPIMQLFQNPKFQEAYAPGSTQPEPGLTQDPMAMAQQAQMPPGGGMM